MAQFVSTDVGKLFNMSFDAFIEQPTYKVELMLQVAREHQLKLAPQLEEAERLLSSAARANKGKK